MLPDFLEDLGQGVYAIDTAFLRPRYDAAYLVVSDEGRAAFIDSGTNHALPRHLAALDALGLAREAVDYVIPTHVHLDHAGGAGALMRELPAATMLVHPRGQRHMIDPSALWQGALAVYGAAEMERSYGALVPVDAQRVRATHDGLDVMLGSRRLHFIDTPGHAKHQHGIWDERTRSWFTGDTFGISLREFDVQGRAWIAPAVVPTQFEPQALHASVRRMLSYEPESMYVTHYGRIGTGGDVPRLADALRALTDEVTAIARRCANAPDRHGLLKREVGALFGTSLASHGIPPTPAVMDMLEVDLELAAQGLSIWLDRKTQEKTA